MSNKFAYTLSFCLGAQQERPLLPGKLWDSGFFTLVAVAAFCGLSSSHCILISIVLLLQLNI